MIEPLRASNAFIAGGYALWEFLGKSWPSGITHSPSDIDVFVPLKTPVSERLGSCDCYSFEMDGTDIILRSLVLGKPRPREHIPCFCGKHSESYEFRKKREEYRSKEIFSEEREIVKAFSPPSKKIPFLEIDKYGLPEFRLISEFHNSGGILVQIFAFPTQRQELTFHGWETIPPPPKLLETFDFTTCSIAWDPVNGFDLSLPDAIADAKARVLRKRPGASKKSVQREEARIEKYKIRGFSFLSN